MQGRLDSLECELECEPAPASPTQPVPVNRLLMCSQAEPERLRGELEGFLNGLGVPHSYSSVSKFANFRNRTLL